MDSDSTARLLLIFVMLGFSGLFSALETTYSFCNRIRIKQLAESGNKRAVKAEKILDNFDNALVALLVGNNLANTLAASTATILCIDLWGDPGAVISTIVTTTVVFIVAETLPKNIARSNCDSFALFMAPIFSVYVKILTPITAIFTGITGVIKRSLTKGKSTPTFTEDEFQDIVDNTIEEGVLEPEETEIIQNSVDFCDTRVCDVMMPVDQVKSVKFGTDIDTILDIGYSRLPVAYERSEGFMGFLRVNDYLLAKLRDKDAQMQEYLSPALYVEPELTLSELFEVMQKNKSHMAFVRDEAFKTVGIVTMEDLLGELVGDAKEDE